MPKDLLIGLKEYWKPSRQAQKLGREKEKSTARSPILRYISVELQTGLIVTTHRTMDLEILSVSLLQSLALPVQNRIS